MWNPGIAKLLATNARIAALPCTTGWPCGMTTASSAQYDAALSTSLPAEATSAHSASRCSNFCCSAARSNGAGPQPAAATVAITMEQKRRRAMCRSLFDGPSGILQFDGDDVQFAVADVLDEVWLQRAGP